MSQVKKQYVVVFFRSSWWLDEAKIFGPFTSKAKAAKARTALYRSHWYRDMGYGKSVRLLRITELLDLRDHEYSDPTTN